MAFFKRMCSYSILLVLAAEFLLQQVDHLSEGFTVAGTVGRIAGDR